MNDKSKSRRRGLVSWFVEPYRQVKLGLIFLVLNLIFSLLILSVFGFYFWDVYKALTVYFQLAPDQGQEIISKLNTPIIVAVLLTGFFVVVTILASVRYTHDIYGPLVSIHRHLDGILSFKNQNPLQLRQSDQLKDLADKVNRVNGLVFVGSKDNLRQLIDFIDKIIKRQRPQKLSFSDQSPLTALTDKLNILSESLLECNNKKD